MYEVNLPKASFICMVRLINYISLARALQNILEGIFLNMNPWF